ncbi:uncharacterized protein [Nicotiana sylvestris]|uniref:Uncharacterized protein LOC104226449 n=1 Tax=Nicotiana sylvestris TaxID=4096 RepID=A0A1U7WHM4_NICSY|nr:PREDICTED: uncharacterized protein LOC104226449 [Nicotiana sylvestris]
MGSKVSPRKLHYDVSMSKRTRKPLNLNAISDKKPQQSEELIGSVEKKQAPSEEERKYERKSLKQLIEVRSISLRQHFIEEEKQLQVMVKQQPEESMVNGLKLKKIVRCYTNVLSHMIKRKKTAGYRMKMQVHKSKS